MRQFPISRVPQEEAINCFSEEEEDETGQWKATRDVSTDRQ